MSDELRDERDEPETPSTPRLSDEKLAQLKSRFDAESWNAAGASDAVKIKMSCYCVGTPKLELSTNIKGRDIVAMPVRVTEIKSWRNILRLVSRRWRKWELEYEIELPDGLLQNE